MTDIRIPYHPDRSGQAEAAAGRYVKHIGKSGRTWLVGNGDDPTEEIFCTAFADPNRVGEGFGGATIPMTLTDGSTFLLKGGFHAAPIYLYEDTGIDLRELHRSKLIIAREADLLPDPATWAVLKDVVYQETEWVVGGTKRWQAVGQEWADRLGVGLHVYQSTSMQDRGSVFYVRPNVAE